MVKCFKSPSAHSPWLAMVIVVGDLQDALRKGKLEILRTVYLLKQEYALGKLKGGENQASFMT